MQETRPEDLSPEEAKRQNKLRQEFFGGVKYEEIEKAMDIRLKELEHERLVRRVKIGRNDPCPCDSGRKFKKCCINKVRE